MADQTGQSRVTSSERGGRLSQGSIGRGIHRATAAQDMKKSIKTPRSGRFQTWRRAIVIWAGVSQLLLWFRLAQAGVQLLCAITIHCGGPEISIAFSLHFIPEKLYRRMSK